MKETYREAVAYIEEIPKFTKKNSLEHTRECLRRLGDPQRKFRVIHVAGTNGKGSVCAFLASILHAGGYHCGLFTSPHLVKINERFQIDEQMVTDETFLRAYGKVRELADALVEEGKYHPTYFEMLFLMGMLIFAEAGVDVVVLETGLGGRLDATTSIPDPLACVITSVSLDHMQYLGDTVSQIAAEKAGIIVPGVPVIYDADHEEAASVIEKTAEEKGCPMFAVSERELVIEQTDISGIVFHWAQQGSEESYEIPFLARYQVKNAALALKCMEVLRDILPVTWEQLRSGLRETSWEGRMEQIAPRVIVDGGHNVDAIRQFTKTALDFQETYPLTLLFSAVSDKDYRRMIEEISAAVSFRDIVTTTVQDARAVSAAELADLFRENGCRSVRAVDKIPEAYEEACRLRGTDGLLFCVGSLYLVGEIKAALGTRELKPEKES